MHRLYTDGSFCHKTNTMAIGGVLYAPDQTKIAEFTEKVLAYAHHNDFEYLALKRGLELCIELGALRVECFADDVNLRKTFNKDTAAFDPADKKALIKEQIFQLKNRFDAISFHHVRRAGNKSADKLAGKWRKIELLIQELDQPRDHFAQSAKLLNIPNLSCADDFADSSRSPTAQEASSFIASLDASGIGAIALLSFEPAAAPSSGTDASDLTLRFCAKTGGAAAQAFLQELAAIESAGLQPAEAQKRASDAFDRMPGAILAEKTFCLTHGQINTLGMDALCELIAAAQAAGGASCALKVACAHGAHRKFDFLLRRRFELPMPNTKLTRRLQEAAAQMDRIILL